MTRTKEGFREESAIPVGFVPMTGKGPDLDGVSDRGGGSVSDSVGVTVAV